MGTFSEHKKAQVQNQTLAQEQQVGGEWLGSSAIGRKGMWAVKQVRSHLWHAQ